MVFLGVIKKKLFRNFNAYFSLFNKRNKVKGENKILTEDCTQKIT